jgi:hypothetical protein
MLLNCYFVNLDAMSAKRKRRTTFPEDFLDVMKQFIVSQELGGVMMVANE